MELSILDHFSGAEHRQLIRSCLAGSKSATLSAAAVNMQTPATGAQLPRSF